MFKSWRLGSLLGFPVEINLSFLLLLGLVLVAFGGLAGVLVVCLAFASVLVHELGHALVGRKLGVHVSGIELSFFGGAAKMENMPRTANHEIAIAAAGPAVSLMLGGLGLGLGLAFNSGFLLMLGYINFVLAAFNLIPALPMDGGRILRALLSKKYDFVRATDIAVTVSRVAAVGFVIYGLATATWMLVVLAPLLWMMGTREKLMARVSEQRFANYGGGGGGGRWDSPFDPRGPRGPRDPYERTMRRFTIHQRDGRVVIEAVD